jgi:hypothetical protein
MIYPFGRTFDYDSAKEKMGNWSMSVFFSLIQSSVHTSPGQNNYLEMNGDLVANIIGGLFC